MGRALRIGLVLVAVIVAGSPGAASAGAPVFARLDSPAPSFTRLDKQVEVSRLTVPVDKSGTLRIDRHYAEVLVGNAEIADVMPLTDRTVYVLGKKIGATRLSILDENKQLVGIVEIEVAHDIEGLRAALRQNLPHARISVTSLNGNVLLAGSVPDAITLQSSVAIANQFAPDAVTNQLIVEGSQQVMLEVRFVEASRNAARDLGVNWQAFSSKAGNFRAGTGIAASAPNSALATIPLSGVFPGNNTPFGSLVARLLTGGVTADVIVQALEERGVARRLAEPNLVALSGDTANFLAGGEFPFIVGVDDGVPIIAFKKFGVGLAFTPTVLANGLINLKIEPEVSEIDPTITQVIAGNTVPGIASRRAKTTIELRDGQSFAIAGLLQSNNRKAQNQLPWIGQVPVLGALFRSASYENNETDLVIIVTPRLVQPAGPEQKLATPFDKVAPGNDVDFFLAGRQEVQKAEVAHTRGGPDPRFGHILSLKP